MNRPTPDSPGNLLIVEGVDDRHVAFQIANRLGSIPSFDIEDREGVDVLLRSIEFDVKTPDQEAIGFLVDADDDPAARWDSVSNRLRSAGIDVPVTADPKGTIIAAAGDTPRIGIWMMPDNQSPGELEDFVAQMIPSGDPVWPLSQNYIDGIPAVHRKFASGKILRAKIHAWLATREDPRQMGLAIRTRDLDINGALCTRFTDWLDRLFT